jgi:hypothetical protein
MRPSRGMGNINPSKMPGKKVIHRKDNPNDVEMFASGGLYANIAAKKRRIASGSGEKMRSAGAKGAPKKGDFASAAKTASYAKGGKVGKNVTTTKGGTASAMAKKLLQKPGSLTAADMFKEGGQSKVNEAGNYTKPELRKRIFNSIKAAAVQGTGAGQWSARKAQLMAKRYKAAGGGYK